MKFKELLWLLDGLKNLVVEVMRPMSLSDVVRLYEQGGSSLQAIPDPVARRALGYVLRADFDLTKAAEACRQDFFNKPASPYSIARMGSGYIATHLDDPAFGRLMYWLNHQRREASIKPAGVTSSSPSVRGGVRLAG